MRVEIADSDDRGPRTLYFLVRYNWTTRETRFTRYDDPQGILDNLGPDETVHRCAIDLFYVPKDDALKTAEVGREMYIESDYIDPRQINARDALKRINNCRAFPVLGKEEVTLYTRYLGDPFKPPEKKEEMEVGFAGRRFLVSVEELE